MAKKSDGGTVILVIVGGVIWLLVEAYTWAKTHVTEIALGIGALVALLVAKAAIGAHMAETTKKARDAAAEQARLERIAQLKAKYNNDEVVEGILSRRIWIGQTAAQLSDSLGWPDSTEEKAMKTRTREVWKSDEARKGQFLLRITLDNDQVTGWDDKR